MINIRENISQLAKAYFDETIRIRRKIHSNPELSFQEFETAEYISSILQKMGIGFRRSGKTGLIAEIPGNSEKTIALRADLDALPIEEKTNLEFASKKKGIMHACGHDVHTACLIGSARILNEIRDQLPGNIRLIFQPGEELLPGGASLMIKDGVLENPVPECIIAQHVMPELPAGKAGFRAGLYMASTDELYIRVIGKGGHGAMPHQNIDPVLISAHLIIALQQAVSRWSKPDLPTVLSIGKVDAQGATNVIPNEVNLAGTFRTFDEKWRQDAHKRLKKLAVGLVESMGGKCEFDIIEGYPFLKNDEKLTASLERSAKDYLGEENIDKLDLRTTAEDFAFYTQHVPACFYRIGTGYSSLQNNHPVHSSEFEVNEDAIKTGTGLMAYLAIVAFSA